MEIKGKVNTDTINVHKGELMKYKNQTENRAFHEMLQAAVKRLQNRSGEDIAAKSGAVFHSSRNVLEVLSFYETIEIQLPEFRINSDMDEWHYLTLLHYLDMADGTISDNTPDNKGSVFPKVQLRILCYQTSF